MCNFAAPDMVGHTGQYEPAVKACHATGIEGRDVIGEYMNAKTTVLIRKLINFVRLGNW